MSDFESVTKELQGDSVRLSDARVLFYVVMERHAYTRDLLYPNARIIQNNAFESAIVKLESGEENRFSPYEKSAITNFQCRFRTQILAELQCSLLYGYYY